MFVKKLVEKASKKPGGNVDCLKPSDVDPRVVYHYGIPAGSNLLAYDSVQRILAISTRYGQIKLFGNGIAQAVLESTEATSSKFLQFVENQGILLNVNVKNHIEVWDIDQKRLSHVYDYKEEITSFTVIPHCLFMYVGDSGGNISVLTLEKEPCHIVQMNYRIPLSASRGNANEAPHDAAVMHVLPQPTAESNRVLIVFRDGAIVLWEIKESRAIFTSGGSLLQSISHETRKVSAACWACPVGSKVAVGYSCGEIFIWRVPQNEIGEDKDSQSAPICKLNLGYKLDKIPIASLKWSYVDGKASRLYVMGASDVGSSNLFQVVLINDQSESRTIKLGLHLSEPCVDTEIISSNVEQSKHKQNMLLLLGKSGHLYAYDDYVIEKYLLQCQSKSPPSLPSEIAVKVPFTDSSITIASFITGNSYTLSSTEEFILLAKNVPPLLPSEARPKEGSTFNSSHFSGFAKIKNLYITGHSDGAINFWDVSCPFLLPLVSIKQQSEDDFSLSGVAVTALFYDGNSRLLVSGDHNGTVRIFKFKTEPFATENSFLSLSGSSRKGANHIIHSLKLIKVNGSVLSVNVNPTSQRLAVGSDQGYVSVVDIEGPTILYQKHFTSELCTGIISLQFETCTLQGFEKNVLVVATKDSSVLALDSDTGNTLTTGTVQPNKPSKALFMQILDERDSSGKVSASAGTKTSSLLICSEKAVYIYSIEHLLQGIKKVNYKKKFHSSACCWASTFYSASDAGLILLFTNGKIEIRSLPDLSLLKESLVKGFTYPTGKLNSISDISVCSSREGELIIVNGDQEILFLSILIQKESFRLLDFLCQVYQKDFVPSQEVPGNVVQKEKKKGIFGSLKSSNTKNAPAMEVEDATDIAQELSMIFSTDNFPTTDVTVEEKEEEIELNIDDIDLDDPLEKPKAQNMMASLNKEKLASTFQAFKGKFKHIKLKNEKSSTKEEPAKEEKNNGVGSVDDIKKKYGFYQSDETSAARMAKAKLTENQKKLEGISLRTTEMQDTARSFSCMAKQMLKTAEHDKKNP